MSKMRFQTSRRSVDRLSKAVLGAAAGFLIHYCSGVLPMPRVSAQQAPVPAQQNANRDAVVRAQEPVPTQRNRPEQRKTAHDNSSVFEGAPSDAVLISLCEAAERRQEFRL